MPEKAEDRDEAKHGTDKAATSRVGSVPRCEKVLTPASTKQSIIRQSCLIPAITCATPTPRTYRAMEPA